jgi:hypothetical protein
MSKENEIKVNFKTKIRLKNKQNKINKNKINKYFKKSIKTYPKTKNIINVLNADLHLITNGSGKYIYNKDKYVVKKINFNDFSQKISNISKY